jgi:hypothetical protein
LGGFGELVGDAGETWVDAIVRAAGPGGRVALLSAPGWLEDVQVVAHIAARLRARHARAHLVSPRHLHWIDGRAHLETEHSSAPLDAIVRFYQAEWMVRLGCRDSWLPLFRGGRTPVSNPGSAPLTESKRLALVWTELDAPTSTWRRLTLEAADPREARRLWGGDWVLKPAFGNTGDDVALRDCMSRTEWARRVGSAYARPRGWVAQRRFQSRAIVSPHGAVHACVGVYVVDGRAAGAYGRISSSRVIDYKSLDTAVLVE